MTLIKVCTKSNEIPRRRRGGYEFTPTLKTVDVDEAAERVIRADDALIVVSIKGDDIEATAELSHALSELESMRVQLAHITAQRDAAVARLTEFGVEAGDLTATSPEIPSALADAASEEFGVDKPAGERIRTERRPRRNQ